MKASQPFVSTMLSVFALVLLLFPSPSLAGMRWSGSGGWGPGSDYSHRYNPATVETVSGEVVKVLKFVPERGMHGGIHLLLRTGKGSVDVHLGPAWFIMKQDVTIVPKDHINVTGSKIMLNGKTVIIAREIRKGQEVLILRDQNGYPVWSGWRRQ